MSTEPTPSPPPTDSPKPAAAATGALEPLKHRAFRMLWSTWLVANLCMWMNDVAAAWMMTSLTSSPLLVALVQTASTLPVFLLGLPSGALADILDRRRFLIGTQIWIALVAMVLCITILMGGMTAPLLLALIFANGIGLALRMPVYAAIVPDLVPRPLLPAALALNGVSMNASRIVGPLVAGAVIASLGTAWVFVLNAVLSLISAVVIMRWQRAHVESPLGRESLGSAIRVGVQFVRESPRFQQQMLRISVLFGHLAALVALLPLLARGLHGGGAGTFTILLAAMGVGAIVGAMLLPRMRASMPRDQLVLRALMIMSASTATMAFATSIYVAVPAMFFAGLAVITGANTLSVTAQMALPNWVRARGMSMYQMAMMGAGAIGAALWGQIAAMSSLQASLCIAATSGTLMMWLVQRVAVDKGEDEDLSPSNLLRPPASKHAPESGQVVMMVEYRIEPARADEFRELMQESRRSRMRQGALEWDLLRDIGDPSVYTEYIVDESWTEHLRRFDRVTAADAALRDRKREFHVGDGPPVVTRWTK